MVFLSAGKEGAFSFLVQNNPLYPSRFYRGTTWSGGGAILWFDRLDFCSGTKSTRGSTTRLQLARRYPTCFVPFMDLSCNPLPLPPFLYYHVMLEIQSNLTPALSLTSPRHYRHYDSFDSTQLIHPGAPARLWITLSNRGFWGAVWTLRPATISRPGKTMSRPSMGRNSRAHSPIFPRPVLPVWP